MRQNEFGIDRSEEIRELFALSVEELVARSKGHLVVKQTLDELYEYLADRMVTEFKVGAAKKGPAAFIMPVGPVQPYRIMARKINEQRIDLRNIWLFFMDEYCDDDDRPISESHPLSFRGQIRPLFFDLIDQNLLMPKEQVVFPMPENLASLPKLMESVGGIDVCYGGIGVHGHVAFNEPAVGVKDTNPRILSINDFTRTVDSTRRGLGGNLINFPRRAITLGLRQCLGARKLLLMTRNEHKGMDWSNTALRIAALGRPGDDYPVTHIRGNSDYIIATDLASASAPETII
jgi:glucosamine-6-phosphate deaminase